MTDEKTAPTVTMTDAFGNEFEVPVGADGVSPVTPNNPPLKAMPEAEREDYEASDEDDPAEVAQEAAEMQGHTDYDPSDAIDSLPPTSPVPDGAQDAAGDAETDAKTEDGSSDQNPAETPAESTSAKPKESDAKPAWVDYAVSRGMDADEANAYTKNDLIEHYKEA